MGSLFGTGASWALGSFISRIFLRRISIRGSVLEILASSYSTNLAEATSGLFSSKYVPRSQIAVTRFSSRLSIVAAEANLSKPGRGG